MSCVRRLRALPLALVLLAPLLLGSGQAPATGLTLVTVTDDLGCAAQATLRPGDVVWPECFRSASEANALRSRLRREGLDAQVLRISHGERAVRYRPLSAAEAGALGRDARAQRAEEEQDMLQVSVDWDPDLRSFRWDLDASCPEGWFSLGEFLVTAYVLAQEEEFEETELIEEPCGVSGAFREDFLFGKGVQLQGSGLALDGRIIHWTGDGCFDEQACPRTATGQCARAGRTVAVDPDVVPLGASLLIEGVGLRRAEDTGGGIKGSHLDVYYGTELSVARANARTMEGRLVCMQDEDGLVD